MGGREGNRMVANREVYKARTQGEKMEGRGVKYVSWCFYAQKGVGRRMKEKQDEREKEKRQEREKDRLKEKEAD